MLSEAIRGQLARAQHDSCLHLAETFLEDACSLLGRVRDPAVRIPESGERSARELSSAPDGKEGVDFGPQRAGAVGPIRLLHLRRELVEGRVPVLRELVLRSPR